MKVDRSDIIAVFALLISFLTFGIGVYETRIMSKEQKMMQSQQEASVWPYLEIKRDFSQGLENRITISVINKGVGPAILNSIEKRGGNMIDTMDSFDILDLMINSMDPELAGSGNADVEMATPSFDLKPAVLSANEEHILFSFRSPELHGQEAFLKDMTSVDFRFCYSNIYGDTWIKEFGEVYPKPTKDCPIQKKEETGTTIMPFSTN